VYRANPIFEPVLWKKTNQVDECDETE